MDAYDPFAPGQCAVSVRTVLAHDGGRDREFPCEIWSPSGQEAGPLVVYSHHSSGHRRAASYLCTHLASHGYVVAALDHSEVVAPELAIPPRLTPEQRAARAEQTWVPARVPDIRFLIDQVQPTAMTGRRLVGIVGHSFGGWTALAAPDDEPRIGSVVALAPGGSEPTPPGTIPARLRFAWGRNVPTLYLVAEDDATLPVAGMYQLYERTPATKRMLILGRADHLHFIDDVERQHEAFRAMPLTGPAAEIQQRMRPIGELCSGEQAHTFVRGLTLAHFDATLRRQDEAQLFLDQDVTAALMTQGVNAKAA